MKDYIEQHVKTKRVFKSDKERKKFLTEDLKLKLQKDPKRNVMCVAVAGRTVMTTGLRVSATRIKEQKFDDDKDGSKESFNKAKEGIASSSNINTKDTFSACLVVVLDS